MLFLSRYETFVTQSEELKINTGFSTHISGREPVYCSVLVSDSGMGDIVVCFSPVLSCRGPRHALFHLNARVVTD
jgi:hypothetical protein